MPTQPTTSQANPFLYEIRAGVDIPEAKLAYFRARLNNRLHELILSTFQEAGGQDQLTRARLATRIGRKPEQITRWFASASNLELGTISDLLLGMGYEPDFQLINLRGVAEAHEEQESAPLPSWKGAAANDEQQDNEEPHDKGLGTTIGQPSSAQQPTPWPRHKAA